MTKYIRIVVAFVLIKVFKIDELIDLLPTCRS